MQACFKWQPVKADKAMKWDHLNASKHTMHIDIEKPLYLSVVYL